jgi:hypothetical protein
MDFTKDIGDVRQELSEEKLDKQIISNFLLEVEKEHSYLTTQLKKANSESAGRRIKNNDISKQKEFDKIKDLLITPMSGDKYDWDKLTEDEVMKNNNKISEYEKLGIFTKIGSKPYEGAPKNGLDGSIEHQFEEANSEELVKLSDKHPKDFLTYMESKNKDN